MTNPRLTRELNDALLLYRTGRVAEACHRAEHIARRHPKDADALKFLGMVQIRMGLLDQAASNLARANKRRPNDPEILTRLASARILQGRFADAEKCFDQALHAKPNFEPALCGKAELFERRGQTEEGIALLKPLMDSGHADAQAASVFSSLLLQNGQSDEALKLASEALSSDRPIKPEIKRRLLLLCGKAHELNERYDDAFERFAEANHVQTDLFDPAAHTREVDRAIATFTPEAWKTAARSHSATERHVFVLGFPRCGSTMVEQVIAAHPEAAGIGAFPSLPAIVTEVSARFRCKTDYPECISELTRQDLDELSRSYEDAVQSVAPDPVERYVDRMLINYMNIGLIELMLPGATIVHVHRNPLDTCVSCFINLQSPNHTYASNLEHLGLAYRQYQRIMSHWRDVLNIPMLEVQYEDLVANQEAETRRIVEYCELPWDDTCLRFHEVEQRPTPHSHDPGRRPMHQASIRSSARYEKHLEPLRTILDAERAGSE